MTKLKLLVILILYVVIPAMGTRSGPFKTSFTRVEPCSKPTLPMDKDPPGSFYAELYNTSSQANVMRGKVTVLREHRLHKMKAKRYLWERNKWKMIYMINNVGCNRIIFPVIIMAIGANYDAKTCTFHKGVYTFNDLNVDKFQHAWMKIQEYGKTLSRIEVYTHKGTVFCLEIETLVVPADK